MNPTIKARIESIRRGEVPEGYKRTKIGIVPNEWGEERLKHYFKRLTRKNSEKNQNVLTISAQYGLISQEEFFNKSVASEDKSNYFLLKKGDFAYNKSYSNGYPYGAIKRLDYYEKGIVSPLYICLESLQENTSDYFAQYFEAGLLNKEIHAVAQEGARNHGLLNIAVEDFFNTRVVVPKVPEQEKIAEILAVQDRVIALKEELLAEKQKQKKYLMQQLLTGKKRLPGFSGEWKTLLLGDVCTIQTGKLDANAAQKNGKFPFFTCAKEVLSINTFSFDGEAILLAGNGDIGTTKLYNGKFDAYQRTYVLMNFLMSAYLIKQYIDFQMTEIVSKEKQGGAMPYIRLSSLEKLPLFVSSNFAEQTAIADILSTADKEIELLKKDIEQEKLKKKSLMQLLLTGIVRVDELVS